MLIDLHTHTAPWSGCAYIDPEESVRLAARHGIDGVCITEHDILWPKGQAERLADKYGILVLRGMEISTQDGHVLVFGVDEYINGMSDVRRLKEFVDAAGGAMVLAHPARIKFTNITEEDMPSLFDAIEVLNYGDSAAATAFVKDLAQRTGMKGTGGSDSHGPSEIAFRATEFDAKIKDVHDLVEALKGNDFRPKIVRELTPINYFAKKPQIP